MGNSCRLPGKRPLEQDHFFGQNRVLEQRSSIEMYCGCKFSSEYTCKNIYINMYTYYILTKTKNLNFFKTKRKEN